MHRLQFAGYCAVRGKIFKLFTFYHRQEGSKYQEFMRCAHGCDSQTPMWDKYLKMLDVWRSCPHEYHLSMAEIQKIHQRLIQNVLLDLVSAEDPFVSKLSSIPKQKSGKTRSFAMIENHTITIFAIV